MHSSDMQLSISHDQTQDSCYHSAKTSLAPESPPSSHTLARNLVTELETIGEYRLLDLLGMGGMCNVYLAIHQGTLALCAVKLSKDIVVEAAEHKDLCYASAIFEWDTYQRFIPPVPHLSPGQADSTSGSSAFPKTVENSTHDAKRRRVSLNRGPQLREESSEHMQRLGNLPRAYERGFILARPNQIHTWMSIQRLGANLHAVATDRYRPLTRDIFLEYSTGMLAAVEMLHSHGMVHCDIKPANFCLGDPESNERNTVYLVDFGFVKPMPSKGDNPYEERFLGTPDFASSGALTGLKCGPRDDCESLCYSYLQLWHKGRIPWDVTNCEYGRQGVSSDGFDEGWTTERLKAMEQERSCVWIHMMHTNQIPRFLLQWRLYVTSLLVHEKPDYARLHRLLCNSAQEWDKFHPKAEACHLTAPEE